MQDPTKEKETRAIFEKHKHHTEPYTTRSAGLEITVLPGVFSPAHFTDPELFAKEVPKYVGNKRLLEVGTGTGIIALSAALQGAEITATDINPIAVKNARLNFAKHGVEAIVLEGSVYDPLDPEDKYDIIFWNHPFNRTDNPNEEMLLKAGFDFQYQNTETYIRDAHKHLAEGGKLLLGTGNIAEIDVIEQIARKHGYEMILLEKQEFPMECGGKEMNDYRIYELKNGGKESGTEKRSVQAKK